MTMLYFVIKLSVIFNLYFHITVKSAVILAGDFNAQLDTGPRWTSNQKSKLLSSFVKRNSLPPLHQLFNSNVYIYVTAGSRIDHYIYWKFIKANVHEI